VAKLDEITADSRDLNYKRHKLQETEIIRIFLLWHIGSGILTSMAHRRWIAPWADSEDKPAIYHCLARVVDQRFAFGTDDK
jgi:hypothetical protein